MVTPKTRKICINTGGGDAPGLNAVIYAATHVAERLGLELYGIREGYDGLLYPDAYPEGGVERLTIARVHGIAQLGGTILGTTNRGNPFRHTVSNGGSATKEEDCSQVVIDELRRRGIDTLIAVGGDGSLTIANQLRGRGLHVIGVPKTIDNDLACTDLTFGYQTAVSFATECIERLHATAESHRRILCVEVMGRYAGWIALQAGVAAMADAILIPEIPYDPLRLAEDLRHKLDRGQKHAIVIVAEGAAEIGGGMTVKSHEPGRIERLGGAGEVVAQKLKDLLRVDTRAVVLGHLLRGGSPIALDRLLGLAFGAAAMKAAAEGCDGVMIALHGSHITHVPLEEAIARLKRVPTDGMGVSVARAMGISLGAAPEKTFKELIKRKEKAA